MSVSPKGLARMRDVLAEHLAGGWMPGLVALVHQRGETHVLALGALAFGVVTPMRRDTIFRIASMTKPITAAAAMILVEECRLRLDEPVDTWLPELAERRVLVAPDAALDRTEPARRPITLRDLLTHRFGLGLVLAPPGRYPIQRALAEAGLAPGPNPPLVSPDEYLKRLGALPLVHHPGERFLYHTASDVLGVLVARVAGQPFEVFLRERIFEPLAMKDTGFHVPAEKRDRLPPSYTKDPASGATVVHDDPAASRWAEPATFPAGGGGLVSTADDYLAFCRMLLDRGRARRGRILSRASVELMTSDQLTPEQKAEARLFFGDGAGWGFGLGVVTRRTGFASVGTFGWDGGCGTSAHSDPAEDLVGILLTQRLMDSPEPPPVFQDFWTTAYAALED